MMAHHLHAADRTWSETNCYSDLWIELLHNLDVDPVAGLAFLLSVNFNGEQWGLFKYPAHDLQAIFGIHVEELHVWQPLLDHLELHNDAGRLLTVEVDAFYLPDLAGTIYRQVHHKTTIAVQSLDRASRSATYFHARGLHRVVGDDFKELFSTGPGASFLLPPYVELVDLERLVRRSPAELMPVVLQLVHQHLLLRPSTNPVERLGARVLSDLPWLERSGRGAFHTYAFGTVRQFGSWASTLATFVRWLATHDLDLGTTQRGELEGAASLLDEIGDLAKRVQYRLARVGTGKKVDLSPEFIDAAERWASTYQVLVEVYLHAQSPR